jgi:hypothetical protein
MTLSADRRGALEDLPARIQMNGTSGVSVGSRGHTVRRPAVHEESHDGHEATKFTKKTIRIPLYLGVFFVDFVFSWQRMWRVIHHAAESGRAVWSAAYGHS